MRSQISSPSPTSRAWLVALGMLLACLACGESQPTDAPDQESGEVSGAASATQSLSSVRLDPAQRAAVGIVVEKAGAGSIRRKIVLPGEIRPDPDRVAKLVPRYPGIVQQIRKAIGDPVKAGDTLAVIESSESLAMYPLKSEIDGTVIAKDITRGEAVSTDHVAFVVADLRNVWVDLSVYQKDLDAVRVGQRVAIAKGSAGPEAAAKLSYVSPVVDARTRTAVARVVLPNPDGSWRPGLFVTGTVTVESTDVPVAIPRRAVQRLDDQTVVFVSDGEQLESRAVRLGRSDGDSVEIVEGLAPGEPFVARGAFTLKSELAKGEFGGGDAD
jgi:cobalt-zinc-cadmium efflux system membrane fusion protein